MEKIQFNKFRRNYLFNNLKAYIETETQTNFLLNKRNWYFFSIRKIVFKLQFSKLIFHFQSIFLCKGEQGTMD